MSLYSQMLDNIKSELAFPQFMKIEKVSIAKSPSGYVADGVVLLPGSMKTTGEKLSKVPIQIMGASQTGAGIYAKVDAGMIGIVQFIGGSKSFPVMTGIYTDKYIPSADGSADISIHGGMAGTIQISNDLASLYTILNDLFTELIVLKTVGSPATQTSSPDNKANFGKGKASLALLMKK